MVKGYTANEYGDFFIASLQQPYKDVVRVLDWEIIVGLKPFNLTGTISTVSGSTTVLGKRTNFEILNVGDDILIGNQSYRVATIMSPIELNLTVAPDFTVNDIEYYLPSNNANRFDFEYRWSVDGKTFSEFRELNKDQMFGDILSLSLNPDNDFYIDIKPEVVAIQPGNTLTLVSMNFILETGSGSVTSCPQFCTDCTDPYAYTGCANIIVDDCSDSNLFQPYNLGKHTKLYKDLNFLVSNIFGHNVTYFRTEPDTRTKDVILMEYSLHNVVDQESVKILVPDNAFPEETITYDIFGMNFEEFEIHIVQQEFERVFGEGKRPRSKDYMFIPLINRMYEISSVNIADEFMHSSSYWRIKLVKYQERSSVIKGEFDAATDTLTTGIEEVFGEEIKEEYEKDTNPRQFQTVTTSYRDGIRKYIDSDLNIRDYDLKNRWTVVSKNYYDLESVSDLSTALEYDVKSDLDSDSNLAVSLWFQPKFKFTDTNEYFLFGDQRALVPQGETGMRMYISNNELKVYHGSDVKTFTHGINLEPTKWYGVIVNFNNEFRQLGVYIYSLDPSINTRRVPSPQSDDNNLILEFDKVEDIQTPMVWGGEESSSNFHLRGNKTYMTNIRVFTTPIELEQHSNVLNQYVVRDNQLGILIDNAIPSIGYQKFKNAR
jgi:hypothetical protein